MWTPDSRSVCICHVGVVMVYTKSALWGTWNWFLHLTQTTCPHNIKSSMWGSAGESRGISSDSHTDTWKASVNDTPIHESILTVSFYWQKIRLCLGSKGLSITPINNSQEFNMSYLHRFIVESNIVWYVKILKAYEKGLCVFLIGIINCIEYFADSANPCLILFHLLLSDTSNFGIFLVQSKYYIFTEKWNRSLLADIIYLSQ